VYIIRFLAYYITLGICIVGPFRYLLLRIFSDSQQSSTANAVAGLILIFTYIIHILFSHKCAVIKSSPGVKAIQAIKIAASEYLGYVKLAFNRS
jgi:hypothetical protein